MDTRKDLKKLFWLFISLVGLFGFANVAFADYNPPTYSKVEVVRNPFGQSHLQLKFHWSSEKAPNFGPGVAVEFEIHVDNKCFVQPVGGKDKNHDCNDRLGIGNFNLPNEIVGPPTNARNCYVDVLNYWAPDPLSIEQAIVDQCGTISTQTSLCLIGKDIIGEIADKDANFAVGLHEANRLKAGITYFYKYPVEINNTQECQDKYGDRIDEGLAWVVMQTFTNTCELIPQCSSDFPFSFQYTCPELIGAAGACLNVNRNDQIWLDNICVPTGIVNYTPVTDAVGNIGGVCEGRNDQGQHTENSCCRDLDNDGYFAKLSIPTRTTNGGDCNDNDDTIHPYATEYSLDGIDSDCDGGDSTVATACSDGIQNQGETGIDCGGPCQACPVVPQMQTLASGLTNPWDIILDATYVYWVENWPSNALRKVPKSGGQVTTLTTALLDPTALVIIGNYTYVLERNQGSNGRISRVPLGGGSPELVVSGLQNAQNHLVQDGTNLFFGDTVQGLGVIKSAPLGANSNASIIVQGNGLNSLQSAIDVDSSYVYFHNDNSQILRALKGGGGIAILGSGIPSVSSIRLGANTIYFANSAGGGIKSIPKAGGSATQLASAGSTTDLVLDGSYLYWGEWPGNISRISMNGGQVKTYWNESSTYGIEVDATYVYWAAIPGVTPNDGKIMRAPK